MVGMAIQGAILIDQTIGGGSLGVHFERTVLVESEQITLQHGSGHLAYGGHVQRCLLLYFIAKVLGTSKIDSHNSV